MGIKRTNEDSVVNDSKKKKQATLFSMFKPKAPANETTSKNENAVDTLSVSTNVSPESASDLFASESNENKALLELEITSMQYDWLKALRKEVTKPGFLKLKKFLEQEKKDKQTIYPPENQIYSWSHYTSPGRVRVVILGQDPYHGPGQAHGLCFSVVKGVKTPPSLVNIYKGVQTDYPDFKKPDHGYLENWAKQGVLMLNTSLTVRRGQAASHSDKGWEPFTDAIIDYLNTKKANIVFMLWGSHAQKKGAKIDKKKHCILKAVHPSPLSAHRGFFDAHHFKKANDFLEERGLPAIDWNTLV
ncbi:uracil-DNA glycosylase [Hesseltinella vesiculosa]|uniref:Uracil-DNA glycosylase n=1 Tax=Hesseltinella vesiculosa TaxID=101127 RepID=A0A1X2GJ26_9FUNG|nr:uracil-DNA glycosylase [Hesseltinella vesiculosa]